MALTVHLSDRIDEVEHAIADAQAEKQEIVDEGEQLLAEQQRLQEALANASDRDDVMVEDEHVADRLGELEAELNRLEPEGEDVTETITELTHTKEVLERKVEEYDGSEFTVKDPTWGDENQVNDLVRAAAIEDDQDDPRAKLGAYQEQEVNVYVVKTPPNAPEQAGEYHPAVGTWLHEKVAAYIRGGSEELGNFSLREEIETA